MTLDADAYTRPREITFNRTRWTRFFQPRGPCFDAIPTTSQSSVELHHNRSLRIMLQPAGAPKIRWPPTAEGKLYLPYGNERHAPVAAEDIARVGFSALDG